MNDNIKSVSEQEFEDEVIYYLTKIGGVKQWEYYKDIKTEEQLWDNFKNIIENNNQEVLRKPLSITEFNQVKTEINRIDTPYKAGQFLHGVNGISQIEVDMDDGRHVYLTIFDQAQVGGGNTVYQIVNQIGRKRVVDGKKNRRFDVTLLINGLPIIQIELKKALRDINDSFHQMHQYIAEKQFSGIFSTLQILIAMTPHNVEYMANTTVEQFNTDFAFHWQDEKEAIPVRDWKEFADSVLSIPMAHDLSTRYMILDGTKNKECIKVMRPYQVHATKKALEKVKKHDFKYPDVRLGYIWHTTGSGKTITSYKTAWLASRLPNVDKVVFLVDRIALTNQTLEAYKAYDPVSSFGGIQSSIDNTENVRDLRRKLLKKGSNNIIVTSIQKMARLSLWDNLKIDNMNILFIIDEAHRSTGDGREDVGMLENIRKKFPTAAWIGYTGTPKFPETEIIFGELIHAYTIKEAIADRNVLGFQVEFKETIPAPKDPTQEDIDDTIKASVYDQSSEHVKLVVKDIFDNWKTRSNDNRYNALFTVHVGGNKPSIPRAMEYFREMIKENEERPAEDRLKIAISFSVDTSNSKHQLNTNNSLEEAIKYYNAMFDTVFDLTTVKEYGEDLVRRLNKTAYDRNFLDLVIVVDQLLTGFDAPELNTLYVDRTLKDGSLIQAYSRTNRIHNNVAKQYGIVVNYRWPKQNEEGMNLAFAKYSNRGSADIQQSFEELKGENVLNEILSPEYGKVQSDLKTVINKLSELTNEFTDIPDSERDQYVAFDSLTEYNKLLSQFKQFTTDDNNEPVSAYTKPEEFYKSIGFNEQQELRLLDFYRELRDIINSSRQEDPIPDMLLEMTHIKKIRVNYDYLIDLIAKMADEVKANDMETAERTKEEIRLELAKSKDEKLRNKFSSFVLKIFNKEYEFDEYPAPRDVDAMNDAIDNLHENEKIQSITDFIRRWGLDNATSPNELSNLIDKHKLGRDDLNKKNEVTKIINSAKDDYPSIADEDVRKFSWITYITELRDALNKLADAIKRMEY